MKVRVFKAIAVVICACVGLPWFWRATETHSCEPTETESVVIQWKDETHSEVTIEPSTSEIVGEPEEGTETETEMETEEVKFFDVPLSEDLQLHIFAECEKHNISPALVIAMIERETDYRPHLIGDNGESYGLMQIKLKYQKERMERLGCTDLLDPYQNVTVGIDILAGKLASYETVGEALTAYNAGDAGARKHYFSKGIYANKYAIAVMANAEELEKAVQ